ncbi:glycine zipper domain-containing protein [Phenylobacterium sp. J367]|uniref:glycine zipper domain-containing protein n=1 Tax=Phenylobacterium sp. J367 TaxID=2898435 RepID=UPI002150D33F|nr:glycine zipper domain-containing protein [Phenylobacterium sp. J367]MCR5877130.1 glycine zipper domain-containing protein [Phenylobacterium sp. J367]
MNATLKIGTASALALAIAAPAGAQYYRPTPEYQAAQAQYDAQRAQYENSREAYYQSREDYRDARAQYDRRLANWERDRARYDARYGYGAYARRYERPTWDEAYWSNRYPAPSAGYYGANASATTVKCNNNSTVTAGVIGALAGAVLGSNVAARNARTEGAVLGAVVGGGLGAAVGNANDKYKCDNRGPYFTYNETVPYREAVGNRSSRYSYYTSQRCRLAPAPASNYGDDYRYVRVCPDNQGRYRITG